MRGETLELYSLLPQGDPTPPSLLAFPRFHHKRERHGASLGPGGWAVALELSGVMEASCFAVEGGQGSGDASAFLSQGKLQELLWDWNSWGRGPSCCLCAP